jgi:hypothetical protein
MSITTVSVSEDVARLLLEGTTPVAGDVAEALNHTTDWYGCRQRLAVLCRRAERGRAGAGHQRIPGIARVDPRAAHAASATAALADLQGEDQRRAAYERDLQALSAFHGALRQTVARLTVTVPAKVFALLRHALLGELAVTRERTTEITNELGVTRASKHKRFALGPHALSLEMTVTRWTGDIDPELTRAGWAGPLERIDRLRGALDQIGSEQAPVEDTELLVSSIMLETLENELEHHEHRAGRPDESKADRIAAAANADLIERFLTGLGGRERWT